MTNSDYSKRGSKISHMLDFIESKGSEGATWTELNIELHITEGKIKDASEYNSVENRGGNLHDYLGSMLSERKRHYTGTVRSVKYNPTTKRYIYNF